MSAQGDAFALKERQGGGGIRTGVEVPDALHLLQHAAVLTQSCQALVEAELLRGPVPLGLWPDGEQEHPCVAALFFGHVLFQDVGVQ